MTAGPLQQDGSGLRSRRLLERRVSRRSLLTLSLTRGAAIAVGQAQQPAVAGRAVLAPEQPPSVPCGACGRYHGPAAVCPVEVHQRALARGFGRTRAAAKAASELATNKLEGGS